MSNLYVNTSVNRGMYSIRQSTSSLFCYQVYHKYIITILPSSKIYTSNNKQQAASNYHMKGDSELLALFFAPYSNFVAMYSFPFTFIVSLVSLFTLKTTYSVCAF